MTYQQHPLSAAFPAMSEDEYTALLDSVTNIGVQNPITLFEGMVLDGWNRYRAAQEIGCECPSVELGDVDPRDFVLAQNKARRHITKAQIALAATEVYRWAPAGRPVNSAGPAELRQDEIAAKAGVSIRTLRQAAKVKEAEPIVKEAVRAGSVGLEKAASIAQLPPEQQAAALKGPRKVQGKPKKVPASKWVKAEIDKADAKEKAEEAEQRAGALEQANQELLARIAALEADNASMAQVFEANDQVAQALAEAKRLRELNAGLNARVQSMLSEIAALKRTEKALRKKLETPA